MELPVTVTAVTVTMVSVTCDSLGGQSSRWEDGTQLGGRMELPATVTAVTVTMVSVTCNCGRTVW